MSLRHGFRSQFMIFVRNVRYITKHTSLMVVFVVGLLLMVGGVKSTQAASTLTIYPKTIQPVIATSSTGPIVDGQETLWINVTRMVNGKALPPTTGMLQKIYQSYKTGRWVFVGNPILGSDKLWWQKAIRPRFVAGLPGAGFPGKFWINMSGCLVDKYDKLPLPGSSRFCVCLRLYPKYYGDKLATYLKKCK